MSELINSDKIDVYKIILKNNSYTEWDIYNTRNFNIVNLNIDPIKNKLFSNDVFTFENNKLNIIHSSLRNVNQIPGVLILNNNKTYGKYKNNKYYYKCIPDDSRLPDFLIPYEQKQNTFSKIYYNTYISFTYSNWDNKHPHGVINQVIGSVNILYNYYEYQLYCKSLNASIQTFQKNAYKALKDKPHDVYIKSILDKYPNIIDRTNKQKWNIFSIDPKNCQDFDDAFSIYNNNDTTVISIYISNVTVWMDILNMWDSFSKRISTIYLPDKKRPMLPTILSDCLCSLQENVNRIAFVLDITIQNNNITNYDFNNCLININNNYEYEETKLTDNEDYKQLLSIVKQLSKKYKYLTNISSSHDVVCYLMILMNYQSAKSLLAKNKGIFRSTILNNHISLPDNIALPDEVSKFITMWKSVSGQYIDISNIDDDDVNKLQHHMLKMDAYIHITSPIRRLVDLLNMITIQKENNIISLSNNAFIFYNKWINELEYINTTMRSIRKVQCDCNLLDICFNDKTIMDTIFEGYIFDKIERNDGLYQYMVYLPKLKLSSRITLRDNFINYNKKMFKIYLFEEEQTLKKKIRLNIVN